MLRVPGSTFNGKFECPSWEDFAISLRLLPDHVGVNVLTRFHPSSRKLQATAFKGATIGQ